MNMIVDIFKNIILNMSLMVLIAYLLTKLQLVKTFIATDSADKKRKLAMSVIFGLVGILSTYTGIRVQGAIANTRVIGVIAGGILGGPIVGIGAGIIAGLHRYLTDIGGFTAVACALSTIVEGCIGGLFSKYVKKHEKDSWMTIAMITTFAEFIQMGIILLIAKPLRDAWNLVQMISIPMILFNSVGVAIFVKVFDSVFIEQDREAGDRIRLVMDIADRCLPNLRKGLYDRKSLDEATEIIRSRASVSGVAVTDRRMILSVAGSELKRLHVYQERPLPQIVQEAIHTGQVQIAEDADARDDFFECLTRLTAVCAPLTQHGEVIGTLVLFIRKFKLSHEVEQEFISGLAKLFSTQIELSQVEYQKKLRQKAEFEALQSQINPHFLFNALSTITSFCREKPERARELLIVLSNYFRKTLQAEHYMISLSEELEHVNAYLELEKARFEEKLEIKEDVPAGISCIVPSFILQPIVENAVKHGAMSTAGVGKVYIAARDQHGVTRITVRDNGSGIPDGILKKLRCGTMDKNSVGLDNVQKRLKSIYGEPYGLQIRSSRRGTEIIIRIPHKITGGELLETRSH